jgi:glycerophosphoryl diester phosphodiesterase
MMITGAWATLLIWAAFFAVLLVRPARADDAAPRGIERFRGRQLLLGAHRGGRGLWPENTLTAFRNAAEKWPAILLEGDVHLTKDGHVVMMHDTAVDRTTDGTGFICNMTLAEIRKLDAGYRFTQDGGKTFPWRGKGIQVPLLSEALAACPDNVFLVETKAGSRIVEETIRVVRECNAVNRFIIAAFNTELMKRARELAPEMATCFDFNSGLDMIQVLRDGGWEEYQPGDDMLAISEDIRERAGITPAEIAAIREKGVIYQEHTINDPDEMRRLLDAGIDSILTDRPDVLDEVIREHRNRRLETE